MPLRHSGKQAQQGAVGAEIPAIGPPDEDPNQEERAAEDQHVGAARAAEEGHERIVLADHVGRAGRGVQNGNPQIDVRQKPQSMLQPGGHLDRTDGDHLLSRTQGADRGTKRAAEEQGERQREDEKRQGPQGDGVGGVEQGLGDVLNGPNRADAAFPPKPEPGQRGNRQKEQAPPRSLHQGKIAGQRKRSGQSGHVQGLPEGRSRLGLLLGGPPVGRFVPGDLRPGEKLLAPSRAGRQQQQRPGQE